MERQRRVRRTEASRDDAERRWDQAYQRLLKWTREADDEGRDIREGVEKRQAQDQTIQQQLTRLRTHLEQQGWECDEERVYPDDGYSGASLSRPGLDRLRDHAGLA